MKSFRLNKNIIIAEIIKFPADKIIYKPRGGFLEEIEEIEAFGDPLIRATHISTFEVTREWHLTERGDCIIAVGANKAAKDLNERFKEIARRADSEIIIFIEICGLRETIKAYGSPNLTFTHPTDIVVRKSSYTCGRTVAIRADKAARDLSRDLIRELRRSREPVKITLLARA
ncbi:MAG: DUF371 domain-containing protein [Candidatus Bathyarchaeia archaeon]